MSKIIYTKVTLVLQDDIIVKDGIHMKPKIMFMFSTQSPRILSRTNVKMDIKIESISKS